jgi:hypothetical protein
LDHFFADFGNAVVVVGSVGAVRFEECELRFVLFAFNEDLLELRPVERYVLGCLFEQF